MKLGELVIIGGLWRAFSPVLLSLPYTLIMVGSFCFQIGESIACVTELTSFGRIKKNKSCEHGL